MALFERIESDIEASSSTVLFGILGRGHVGKICLSLLIDLLQVAKVGECSTPALPAVLLSEGDGFGRLPTLEYYFSEMSIPKIFAVTGDVIVNELNHRQFYDTIEHVVSLAKKLGASQLIAIDGRPGKESEKIKVFASRPSLARKAALPGVAILENTRIRGYSGVAVGLGRMYGLDSIGVTVPCENPSPNKHAGLLAFKYLISFLDLKRKAD